jgi:hypothetical protein
MTDLNDRNLEGGCACGAFRFSASGTPLRVGLCHCMTCRKHLAAPFGAFAAYPAGQVKLGTAATIMFKSSEDGRRYSCAACGSPVYDRYEGNDEIELMLGSFDDTSVFTPTYELWTRRRETWLPTLPHGPHLYEEDRTATAPREAPDEGPESP